MTVESAIIAGAAVLLAFISFISASKANTASVEAKAYESATIIYDRAITQLRSHNGELEEQIAQLRSRNQEMETVIRSLRNSP